MNKLILSAMTMTVIVLLYTLMVYAADCNGFPDSFYGTIHIDNEPAPIGTEIRPVVGGTVGDIYTTDSRGGYGDASGQDKLYVYCDETLQVIAFEVMVEGIWIQAHETTECICGQNANLNLTVTAPEGIDDDEDGYTLMDGDCDDSNPLINPGADEVCNGIDDDCDDIIDETFTPETCEYTCESDGFVWTANGAPLDCCGNDLGEAEPYETTESSCMDGHDNDCDGLVDSADPDCENQTEDNCTDMDEDGYDAISPDCPEGSDCDDMNASINPGAQELCNGVDEDCDGEVDEGFTNETCQHTCVTNEFVWTGNEGSLNCCGNDDGEGQPYEAAESSCEDGNDNDCDGMVDYDDPDCINQSDYNCTDHDEDGYYQMTDQCPVGTDCEDADPSVNPGALEVCNGLDDDCDGEIDENATSLCDDGMFCNGQEVCMGTDGCVQGEPVNCSQYDHPEIGQCDYSPDDNPFTWDYAPAFTSICDEELDMCTTDTGLNHTCDIERCDAECVDAYDCNLTDCSASSGCYNGTYREYHFVMSECIDCTCQPGACTDFDIVETDLDGDGSDVECEGDCNDTDPEIYPGNIEVCDGKDNDCDGIVDEDCACQDDADCESGFLCINGTCVERDVQCDLYYPIYLQKGWNMLGFPSCEEHDITVGLMSIDGNYMDVFSLVEGEWLNYHPDAPPEMNTLHNLTPLQGVYIDMSKSDVLRVSP